MKYCPQCGDRLNFTPPDEEPVYWKEGGVIPFCSCDCVVRAMRERAEFEKTYGEGSS